MDFLKPYLSEESSDLTSKLALSFLALLVAIPVLLVWQSFAFSIVFATLNAVLCVWHPDVIPFRDVAFSFLVMLLLLLLGAHRKPRQEQVGLKTTRLMAVTTAGLMTCEVSFLLLTPWIILVSSSLSSTGWGVDKRTIENLAYVLVPHLFIFQSQIALESMIKERHGMGFWYTVLANSYRGAFGIVTWIKRYQIKRDEFSTEPPQMVLLLDTVSTLAIVLWCTSMVFIALIWYPCLTWKTLKKQ
ncbi:hypothetical protein MHU86_20981 [Fragilaria crotonensis]|nr:hypothetical protein MHU86_20981 [Fragilaria crotonensis]